MPCYSVPQVRSFVFSRQPVYVLPDSCDWADVNDAAQLFLDTTRQLKLANVLLIYTGMLHLVIHHYHILYYFSTITITICYFCQVRCKSLLYESVHIIKRGNKPTSMTSMSIYVNKKYVAKPGVYIYCGLFQFDHVATAIYKRLTLDRFAPLFWGLNHFPDMAGNKQSICLLYHHQQRMCIVIYQARTKYTYNTKYCLRGNK